MALAMKVISQVEAQRKILEEAVSTALELASGKSDGAEVAVSKTTGISVSTRYGEVENVEFNSDGALGITVYHQNRKGSASSTDLSPQAIARTVQAALDIARYTSPDPYAGVADKELLAFDAPDLDLFHPADVSPDEAIELAARAEQAALQADKRITNTEGGSFNSHYGVKVFGNSHGMLQGYCSTRHSLSSCVIAEENGDMERDYAYTIGRAMSDLQTPEWVGADCARRTLSRLSPRKLSTMKAPVIFANEVATGLFGHLVGAIAGGAVYRKSTFSLEYEVNTLHTANGQTPFVTFGFGLGTSWESRLIQESILRNRIAGLGKNRKTAVFPKLVFAIRDGLNHKKGDPNYDIKQLALECASKRMYPDILNYDQVVKVTGSFKTPMGCRSFLGVWENENGEQIHDGRNNLGVISLNLPRIALEAKGDEATFWKLLDERLVLARKALMTRIARLEGVKARVAPILYMEGACGVRLNADDDVSEIFKNGRASISLGYIGIHETINALFGGEHVYDNEQLRAKGIAIVERLRQAVDQWKEETGYGFSLYSTPSENLCDRFCRLDTAEFGVVPGVTDKGYYTNSFHLDVEKKVNPYDKIDFEAPYPPLANGGFICYGEYPNIQHNLKALEDVWDYSYQHVPYYGTNTPIDECYECGFTGEFECTSKGFTCPKCGNHDTSRVSVTRRVCGYLGSPDARPFNAGKQEEVKRRVKHLGNGQIG